MSSIPTEFGLAARCCSALPRHNTASSHVYTPPVGYAYAVVTLYTAATRLAAWPWISVAGTSTSTSCGHTHCLGWTQAGHWDFRPSAHCDYLPLRPTTLLSRSMNSEASLLVRWGGILPYCSWQHCSICSSVIRRYGAVEAGWTWELSASRPSPACVFPRTGALFSGRVLAHSGSRPNINTASRPEPDARGDGQPHGLGESRLQ